MQHERQDRTEFFVECETESAVIIKALVAGFKNFPALCFTVVALDPFSGMYHGASGSAAASIGVNPHNGSVVGFFDSGHFSQKYVGI